MAHIEVCDGEQYVLTLNRDEIEHITALLHYVHGKGAIRTVNMGLHYTLSSRINRIVLDVMAKFKLVDNMLHYREE